MNHATKWFFLGILMIMLLSTFISGLPSGPIINYITNSTAVIISPNRTQDAKGTITTITMSLNQQDFKWKAYIGNVSGKLALSDASGKSIYDWTLGAPTGEVYATKSGSTINWANISCATQSLIDSEETSLSMPQTVSDNINNTFINFTHRSIQVATTIINQDTCRSTATFVNSLPQVLNHNSNFQEVLLQDGITNSLIYTTLINASTVGYDGSGRSDFQLLVAENESSVTPSMYFFYVELG